MALNLPVSIEEAITRFGVANRAAAPFSFGFVLAILVSVALWSGIIAVLSRVF
jgi:hypothetical protein